MVANGWIEGLTVGAIILGTMLGGASHPASLDRPLRRWNAPLVDTRFGIQRGGRGVIYLIAAAFNFYIPDTGVDHKVLKSNPIYLFHDFNHCLRLLWRDKLGQISLCRDDPVLGCRRDLAVHRHQWAEHALRLDLAEASMLQGVVAVGVAVGAILAARVVTLRNSVRVIPIGIAMGVVVLLMTLVTNTAFAMVLMVLIGALADSSWYR